VIFRVSKLALLLGNGGTGAGVSSPNWNGYVSSPDPLADENVETVLPVDNGCVV